MGLVRLEGLSFFRNEVGILYSAADSRFSSKERVLDEGFVKDSSSSSSETIARSGRIRSFWCFYFHEVLMCQLNMLIFTLIVQKLHVPSDE